MASAPSSASGVIIDRNWKSEIESMLKIPLPTGNMPLAQSLTSSSSPHGTVLQNRSVRTQQDRLTTLKRRSIWGLQSILGAQGYSPYSGGSSKDGRASPALSFATLNEGMHGSSVSFLAPALGFASNLSHTTIREQREDSDHSLRSDTSPTTDISITDEELALLGPPWAKKGMLCRKQYWECTGKRAKSKTWMDVFVAIQKGELSMFTFGQHGLGGSSVVGGGNWLSRPSNIDLQTRKMRRLWERFCLPIRSPMRCPARLQPTAPALHGADALERQRVILPGRHGGARERIGVNVRLLGGEAEQGAACRRRRTWNTVGAALQIPSPVAAPSRKTTTLSRTLTQRAFVAGVALSRTWPFINDWKPPLPPSVASTHDEETQLEALQKHVAHMKEDLQQHNELRTPMT
ncbi:hypothetical protein BD310DRAFT_1010860 [Dichomitus squalens]|uniref:Uncharacterized protein n=1 Tax=Dichomitus squalens TaxID=114155 RepID=A0A4Q9P9K4_9APHY|nr:hypothetical protein BD310DRAFT_1010860 [Dichomitus squalens]